MPTLDHTFFSQVVSLVSHLSMLVSIDLRENRQLVKLPMYRTRVIVAGRGLQQVDGRPVDATTRSGCFEKIGNVLSVQGFGHSDGKRKGEGKELVLT